MRINMNKADKHDMDENSYMKGCPQQLFQRQFGGLCGFFRSCYSSDHMFQVAVVQQPLAFSLDLAIAN